MCTIPSPKYGHQYYEFRGYSQADLSLIEQKEKNRRGNEASINSPLDKTAVPTKYLHVCQLLILSKIMMHDRYYTYIRTINRMDTLLSGQPASMDTKMLLTI